MHMTRIVMFLAVASGFAQPQTRTAATPKFEVASIKRCVNPSVGEGEGRGGAPRDSLDTINRMRISCWSLSALIQTAYVTFAGGHFNGNNNPVKIEQLPAWGNSETYTIDAKANGNQNQFMMRGPMLQALLEDRFALKIHATVRDEPAFALTVGKGGLKAKPFRGGCTPLNPINPPKVPVSFEDLCHATPQDTVMSLDILAWSLGRLKVFDAPVINRTGIVGYFHFNTTILFRPALPPGVSPTDEQPTESVFAAVQDIGLKLQAVKAPRQYFVVDHVERPSAN